MVHIVGAGPGDPELITVKGQRYLREADVVIYAGSLVNPALLELCKPGAEIHNSASMTLDEVVAVIENAEQKGQVTVRLDAREKGKYTVEIDPLLEAIRLEKETGGDSSEQADGMH